MPSRFAVAWVISSCPPVPESASTAILLAFGNSSFSSSRRFAGSSDCRGGNAGDPASGARQARDMAGRHRVVVGRDHDDRRVAARLLERDEVGFATESEEYIEVLPPKLGGKFAQPVDAPLCVAELDHEIAPLGEPEFAQTLHEGNAV